MERLSQQNHVIKICIGAGFLKTVEVEQYFMTKHTDDFLQFAEPVTCREYTLPRDEKSTDLKGSIRGNTKIGPYWKSQPATYMVNIEWKLEFILYTKTILTRGSEFLMAWISWSKTSETTRRTKTTSRKPPRCSSKILRWKTNVFAFASRSKPKAKPRRPSTTCSSTKTVSILERTWIDIEPGAHFDQA